MNKTPLENALTTAAEAYAGAEFEGSSELPTAHMAAIVSLLPLLRALKQFDTGNAPAPAPTLPPEQALDMIKMAELSNYLGEHFKNDSSVNYLRAMRTTLPPQNRRKLDEAFDLMLCIKALPYLKQNKLLKYVTGGVGIE